MAAKSELKQVEYQITQFQPENLIFDAQRKVITLNPKEYVESDNQIQLTLTINPPKYLTLVRC
jgi:hypothetical protein